MSEYFWLKTLHVLSATILFGTGLGIAFFKWVTDRSGNVQAIRVVAERVVLADWIFTTPAARYWQYARLWFWLGVPAFVAVVVIFGLMVWKPASW